MTTSLTLVLAAVLVTCVLGIVVTVETLLKTPRDRPESSAATSPAECGRREDASEPSARP
jgi:hypothetical protein